MELEYSLAFRLLIYRIDTTAEARSTNNSQRAQCIGKFHRNVCFIMNWINKRKNRLLMIFLFKIESALHEGERDSSGLLTIESPANDLKLKISIKYSKREGTFKRQGSKRSLAVFGKSIEQLLSTPNGWYEYTYFRLKRTSFTRFVLFSSI